MAMRDTKKGPIFDKFKEGVKSINRKLIRNSKAQEIKKAAKGLGFRKSEARDMAKRYRRNELEPYELKTIQNKFMVDVDHIDIKDQTNKRTLSVDDAKAISNSSNQIGNTPLYEQVYNKKQGIKPTPTNNKPLVNPIAKEDDNK